MSYDGSSTDDSVAPPARMRLPEPPVTRGRARSGREELGSDQLCDRARSSDARSQL